MSDLATVYSAEAQQTDEWLEWLEPRRFYTQIDTLCDATLPTIPVAEPFRIGKTVPPRPVAARYSAEMLEWVEYCIFALLPTEKALKDNAEIADQFICYIVEYLARNADGEVINVPGTGVPVHDGVGPSVFYKFTPEVDNVVQMLLVMIEHGEGLAYVDLRTGEYAAWAAR